jgi:hypothetical protein
MANHNCNLTGSKAAFLLGSSRSWCTLTDCAVMASPGPPRASQPGGSGAYAIRALPDLCFEIVSERLETSGPSRLQASPLVYDFEAPAWPRGFL